MLFDLNTFDKKNSIKSYDICVSGAGPSGITLARKFAEAGLKVALFEGGSLEYTDESQSIYEGKSIGLNDWGALSNCRLRFFGGSSNHWGGRCSFFDRVDFEKRDYFGVPGWPVGSRDEMFKHLGEVCNIVDLPKNAFKELPKSHWKSSNFRLSEYELSSPPTCFRTKYINELKQSKLIDVFINANLTDINLHENLKVAKAFQIKNYSGQEYHFTANRFVLAMGATENSKILLNSDKQVQGGIGNQNDMVGRCFMEHFNVRYGNFIVEDKLMWTKNPVQFNPTEAFIRNNKIGNAVLDFEQNAHTKVYGRLHVLKGAARDFVCQSTSVTDLAKKVTDFECDGDGVITSLIEQTPNFKSRITLGTERGMFGLRRVILDWQPNHEDDRTIRILGREIAKEFARTRLARVKLKDFILDDNIPIRDYGHHCHQMGGTRISDDPKIGVVDTNQRVHGIDNLFIAGSSVFPTGGGCNPTLTVLMTTLSLAEHMVTTMK